jgi:hypothetical protein
MSIYKPQRAWVLLTILWFVCNLIYALLYLQGYRRAPSANDWLTWSIMLIIPPLIFWWVGIVFRITPRRFFWGGVATILVVGLIAAFAALLAKHNQLDSTSAKPASAPVDPASVTWDDLKTITIDDMAAQPIQPLGGCRSDVPCQAGFSCMKCDKQGCVTAGSTLAGMCYRLKPPTK